MRLRTLVAAAFMAAALGGVSKAAPEERRLILVTIDGLSWTEVFRGANVDRAADKAFVSEPGEIKALVDAPDRARALMPFVHDTMARQGVLLGDRDHGGCAAVSNDQWFSYPGYNEILTGRADPKITSNAHGPNANISFLEWLNGRPAFHGKVEAVTSWSAFSDILNVARSGLFVDAGWEGQPRGGDDPARAALERHTPHVWPTGRYDSFTHAHALQALTVDKPRVLYISYNDTDDFAHEGHYDQTLLAARRADAFLSEIWRAAQADPAYAGRTTLIVTVDHGRGTEGRDAWRGHGKAWPGSDGVWMAAMGPGIAAGAKPATCAMSNQIAATALVALGLDWRAFDPSAGPPLDVFKTH